MAGKQRSCAKPTVMRWLLARRTEGLELPGAVWPSWAGLGCNRDTESLGSRSSLVRRSDVSRRKDTRAVQTGQGS